jgi:hypothetical protein
MTTGNLYEIEYVRGLVNAQMGAIRACFVAAEFDPIVHEFPYYAVGIDDAGQVLSVTAPGTDVRDLTLDACIGRVIRGIAWGPPAAGVTGRRFDLQFSARIE